MPNVKATALGRFTKSDKFTGNADFAATCAALTGQLVYLATPYSKEVMDSRGRFDMARSIEMQWRATRWAGLLAINGITAFAPITIAADIAHQSRTSLPGDPLQVDPMDAEFWMGWCLSALRRCQAVVVPPIAGRERSVGIGQEIEVAISECHIPVYWLAEGSL